MKEFMKWLEAEKIDEHENEVCITLKNNSIIDLLVEDYNAKKITDVKLIMSKDEFEVLKGVYKDSLISWR